MKPSTLILGVLYFAVMFYVGSMILDPSVNNDYEMAPSQQGYINVYGEPVELSDYFGNYLWVDYAAEWCSYCDQQTKILKALERKFSGHFDFLTVLTGTSKVMQPPTGDTAKDWGKKHKLNLKWLSPGTFLKRFPITYSTPPKERCYSERAD